MATKVLVFESDIAFASELQTELSKLGSTTRLVEDGTAGIEAAILDRPDLILLAIELPKMNGFSICNKIKRDPSLKDVPLIIMSSESSEETFEQHRKLRTRADDYVHKPIAFGELLERIRKLVSFDGEQPRPSQESIVIDEIELDDDVVIDSGAGSQPLDLALDIDEEVDAFAESAFDRLLDGSAPPPPPAPSGILHSSAAPASLAPTSAAPISHRPSVPPPRLASVPPRPPGDVLENERLKAEIERLQEDLATSKSEAARLQDQAEREARQSAEVQRLQRELDEAKTKAASGGRPSGVSSREFLDLREALNKKDKELLGLRDQISRREKELLDVRDVTLALEREKADHEDQIFALEKDVADARSLVESLRADKEQAAKRADDFKARAEKTKGELDAKLAELAATKQRHAEEVATLGAEHRQALEQAQAEGRAAVEAAEEQGRRDLAEAVAAARAEEVQAKEEAVAAAAEEARRAQAQAVAAREAELTAEHEDRLASLYRANEEERAQLIAAHSAVREELTGTIASLEATLADARARIEAIERAKQEAEQTRDARIAALTADLATETENRERLASDLAEARNRITELDGALTVTKTDLADAREKLVQQSARAEKAYAKWDADRVSLARAKEALATVVAEIEEAESRKLED